MRAGKYRAPDLLLLLDANDPRRQDEFWLGADLVIEIVSVDKPKRDTEEKPRDYAEAHIPKYQCQARCRTSGRKLAYCCSLDKTSPHSTLRGRY